MNLQKAVKKCSRPERVCLVVVADEKNRRTNITPVSWNMWTSTQPRIIAFSLHRKRYSHELLISRGECVLAWPGSELIQGVIMCGTTSGRDVDKFALTGWTPAEPSRVKTSLISECIVNLECNIINTVETGDHTVFFAHVSEGHVLEDNRGILFTVNEDVNFDNLGGGKGYRFGIFRSFSNPSD